MKISEITFNEGINDKYIGKCVFTAGAPASGKTTISRKLFSHLGFREVNIDKLLEFFAEIKGLDLKNMHTWDKTIFDRSEDLTFSSMEMFIKGRLPLLIDGTGRNYKKITQLATRLKEDYGYDAGLLFVNTSLQVSIKRNSERNRSLTDMQYIKDAWKDSQSNLGIYQNFFGNNLFIVDNNSRSEADLTSVSKRIDKFIDIPTKNLKFNQWIADEKKKRNITEAFLTNSTYYTADMLTEQKLYEGFLDTAKQYLGSKYNMKISDISGAINDMREAGILIKEIIQSPEYLEKVMIQLKKTVKGFIKQMTNAVKSNETLEKLWNSIKNRVLKITSAIGWKGFLANLGMSGFLKFLLINGRTLKQNTALEIMDLVVDLEKLLPNATLPGFLQLYEGLQLAKKYFFDILTGIKKKLDFGRNITEDENSESEIRKIAEDFREWMEDKGYEELRGHAFDSSTKEAYHKFEGLCNKASRKLAKIYNDKGYNAVSRLITYYGDDLTFWERHGIAFFDNEEDFEDAEPWEFGEDHEVVIIDGKIVVDVTSDQFNPENPDDHKVVVVPVSDRRYKLQSISNKVFTEDFEDDGNNLLKIREFIEQNCQPYLKEIGGIEELPFTLMHGSNSSALKQNIATIITINQERKPKDTPLYIHDQLNAGLMKAGFKAHRGNSIFVSGHNGVSGSYGQTYIVIPIGEYHYTWGMAKYGPIRDLWDLQPYIDMANQGYMSIDDDEMQEGANLSDDEMSQFKGDTGKFIKQIMDEIDTLKNYQLHFHDLEDYFKKYYKVDNLEAAIRSGAEVYLHAQKVVMLNDAYVDDLLNAEAPKARPRPGKA